MTKTEFECPCKEIEILLEKQGKTVVDIQILHLLRTMFLEPTDQKPKKTENNLIYFMKCTKCDKIIEFPLW